MGTGKETQYDGGLLQTSRQEIYIGIDQSYTGFGVTAFGRDGTYHTWVYEGDGTGVHRLVDIRDWFENLIYSFVDSHQPWRFTVGDVAMEGYAFASQMAHMAGELGGMVKMALDDYGARPLLVPPATLKKFATGQGTKVNKSLILLSVYKNWGVEFKNDNAADSYVLARIASSVASGGGTTLAAQRDVVAMLTKDPDKYRA